jgi:hypothetical protein
MFHKYGWQSQNTSHLEVTPEHIGNLSIGCSIKSSRPYHASGDYDDYVELDYVILPSRSS